MSKQTITLHPEQATFLRDAMRAVHHAALALKTAQRDADVAFAAYVRGNAPESATFVSIDPAGTLVVEVPDVPAAVEVPGDG